MAQCYLCTSGFTSPRTTGKGDAYEGPVAEHLRTHENTLTHQQTKGFAWVGSDEAPKCVVAAVTRLLTRLAAAWRNTMPFPRHRAGTHRLQLRGTL